MIICINGQLNTQILQKRVGKRVSENIIFILKAFVMGIVEGITEFLPISSTAHLIITQHIIGFVGKNGDKLYNQNYIDMFLVVIQLGAILAIIVLYWNKIRKSFKNLNPGKWGFKLWLNILIAFLPVAIIGLLLHKYIDIIDKNVMLVALAMVIGGVLLIVFENIFRKKFITRSINKVRIQQSIKIGLFQCLSLWPGMSRSASTIMGGWIGGLSTPATAEFSFFLAIPTMVAASGYKIIETAQKTTINSVQIIALSVGFFVSFIVALIVVEQFINFLKRKKMRIFGVYRVFAGVILFILIFTNVIK